MVQYSNLSIEYALDGLCRLIAPKRTVILICFIFIIFVNILTCLKTNLQVSTLPSHNYHHIDSDRSSSLHNVNSNTSADSYASTKAAVVATTTTTTTTSTTTTESPETKLSYSIIAQPFESSIKRNHDDDDDRSTGVTVSDAIVSDNTTDITLFQHNEKEFNNRNGLSATSSVGQNLSSTIHSTITSTPKTINASLGITTTPSSISDNYDSDDELRKIYMGNTLLSISSEETTTLASSRVTSNSETISDNNVGQIVSDSAHRNSNDMLALETNASTSINSIERDEQNFKPKSFKDAPSSESTLENRNRYNPAPIDAQRLRPSLLHNIGPYQLQPVGVQATQRPPQQGPVQPEDRPQVYDQTDDSQQPSLNSLISNTSLLDLLHIIKHLNLMNDSSDSLQPINSNHLLNSSSNINPINNGSGFVLSPLMHLYSSGNNQRSMMPVINSNQYVISSGGSNLDKSLHYENGHVMLGRKMKQPSPPRATPEILSTLESSLPGKIVSDYQQQTQQQAMITNEPDRKLAMDQMDSITSMRQGNKLATRFASFDDDRPLSKKPPKHALITPPYIANFDSGLESPTRNVPINRTLVSTLTDKIRASSDLNKSDSRHKTDPSKIDSSTVKIQPSLSVIAKLDHPKSNQILYYSPSTSDQPPSHRKTNKKHQTNKQHKSTESQESRNKSKATAKSGSQEPSSPQLLPLLPIPQSNLNSNDVNSKRGERDTYDNSQSQRANDSHTTSEHADESEKAVSATKMKQTGDKSSDSNYQPNAEPNQVRHKVKESSPNPIIDRTYTSSSTQSRHVKSPIKLNVGAPALDRNTKPVPAYLSDPHKKSYYWTSDRGDVHLDDINNIAPHYPLQLTIGQLARQHGITPLGLQHTYPLSLLLDNLNLNHHQTAVEDFGLSSESGFSEEYASFVPPNNHRDPSIRPQHHGLSQEGFSDGNIVKPASNSNNNNNGNNSHFELDEQLKQKIAIKAIEAATKDPELSAKLFGSLLNLAGGDLQDATVNSARLTHSHQQNHYQTSGLSTKPNLSIPQGGINKNAYKSYSPTDALYTPVSSSIPAVNPLNHVALMMPMATMQDNQYASSLRLPMNSSSSSSAQPINLVITDLANRWALSRMPDLVPIPLAATVPGYLIRLPDGKILAAALTNPFSIQGIQPGPLAASYKNLINNKFSNLVKSPTPSVYNQVQQAAPGLQYGGSVADSNLRPTLVLPAHHHYHYSNRFATKAKNNPPEHKGGFFTRAVLSQLGLGARTSLYLNNRTQAPKLYSASESRKNAKNNINSNGANTDSRGRPKSVKLAGSPFPVPSLTGQELANLPIASPNEPVFSFADESQLLDTPDHLQSRPPQFDQPLYEPSGFNQASSDLSNAIEPDQQPQQQLDLMESGRGTNFVSLSERLNELLSNSRNIAHLDRLGGLNDDQSFKHHPKKRKSFTNFSLSKLEPLYQWLASIKPVKLLRKDSIACTKKI